MRILITMTAPDSCEGLEVLERNPLTLSDDVWIVAPENRTRSGLAHSLTLPSR